MDVLSSVLQCCFTIFPLYVPKLPFQPEKHRKKKEGKVEVMEAVHLEKKGRIIRLHEDETGGGHPGVSEEEASNFQRRLKRRKDEEVRRRAGSGQGAREVKGDEPEGSGGSFGGSRGKRTQEALEGALSWEEQLRVSWREQGREDQGEPGGSGGTKGARGP